MKLIKISIQEVTTDVSVYRLAKHANIQHAFVSSIDELPTTMAEPEIEDFQREIYGYGRSYKESFYIRKEDKEAMLELLKGFTNYAKKEMLVKMYQYIVDTKNPPILEYITELIRSCDRNE